ncbi:hypothetical protein B0I37DRAFT_358741 [Chaetomium sp. MPI-CAGE-AT-0009]|nr:hypothetical protein B0I37DRAFT_358741 [Chaetomium sp. MPI-CAGE-AT-0009]
MRVLTTFPALAALLLSTAAAQTFPNQFGPYALKVTSDDATINGKYLYACHSGAAIEQLCIGEKGEYAAASGSYYFNSSDWSEEVDGSKTGVLIWNLPLQDAHASSALTFNYSPASNVVLAYFIPGDQNTVTVGFDAEDKLFVAAYVDDTVTPGGSKAFYHWEVCNTQFSGYRYQALAWVTIGTPINESCRGANVTREAI